MPRGEVWEGSEACSMADYYSPIANAVAQLKNDQDRRRIYEHGRNVLREELEASSPPLRLSVIMKELFAFDEAVRKVEAEVTHPASDSEQKPEQPGDDAGVER
jgi:hypothetical protein